MRHFGGLLFVASGVDLAPSAVYKTEFRTYDYETEVYYELVGGLSKADPRL